MDPDFDGQLKQRARLDFELAYFKSFRRSVVKWLTSSQKQLLPFEEIRNHIPFHGQHEIGILQVPIEKIVGGVNRYQDFDENPSCPSRPIRADAGRTLIAPCSKKNTCPRWKCIN